VEPSLVLFGVAADISPWVRIKNPRYGQMIGRREQFQLRGSPISNIRYPDWQSTRDGRV